MMVTTPICCFNAAFSFVASCPSSRTVPLSGCFFGDIHEVLPISKATVSQHLKELKDAGLIQGEIETPKVKYCINRENWKIASTLFAGFFGQCVCKKESCCE